MSQLLALGHHFISVIMQTNLMRWGKIDDPKCGLCSEPGHLEHILSSILQNSAYAAAFHVAA